MQDPFQPQTNSSLDLHLLFKSNGLKYWKFLQTGCKTYRAEVARSQLHNCAVIPGSGGLDHGGTQRGQ